MWKKKSHELGLCHSLTVDSFDGSKSSFFFVSLSDCMFFLGSKLNLVWHSHVRYWWSNKGLDMGFGVCFEVWELSMNVYIHEWVHSTAFSATTIALLLLCYAGSLSQSACAKIMLWLWLIFLYFTLRLKLLDSDKVNRRERG